MLVGVVRKNSKLIINAYLNLPYLTTFMTSHEPTWSMSMYFWSTPARVGLKFIDNIVGIKHGAESTCVCVSLGEISSHVLFYFPGQEIKGNLPKRILAAKKKT